MSLLILKPECGLGNRLSAVVSAQILARHMGRELRIDWPNVNGCKCDMPDLFEGVPFLPPSQEELEKAREFPQRLTSHNMVEFLAFAASNPVVYVRSIVIFFPHDRDVVDTRKEIGRAMRRWRLLDTIQSELLPLPSKTIGIHLRYKDQWAAVRFTPLIFFRNYIESEIAKDRDVCFFICSDTPWCIDYLTKKYGEQRIISYKAIRANRNETAALQEALRDLITLAATTKIVASPFSTFCRLAAIFGSIPLTTLSTNYGKWPGNLGHPVLKLFRWDMRAQKWVVREKLGIMQLIQASLSSSWINMFYHKFYQLGFWHRPVAENISMDFGD